MKDSPSKTKKPAIKKDLLLLFAAPIIVIALAAALVYTPRLFANPSYDFIYSSCVGYDYGCERQYRVGSDGRITIDTSRSSDGSTEATLYYFDSSANTSKRIDYPRALDYTLLPSKTSPDNYRLESSSNSGGFLLWSGSSYDSSWYLADGLKKKRLNLPNDFDTSIKFIGWVEK